MVPSVLLEGSSARPAVNVVILHACATKSNHLLSQGTPRHIRLQAGVVYVQEDSYVASQVI